MQRTVGIALLVMASTGLGSPASAQLGDCTRIGPTATNHTCGHGENGPYADLTAVSAAVVGTPIPQKHVYTTVTLPGSDGVFQGELQWRYPNGGYHSLWTLGDVPIVVRDFTTGEIIPEELGHDFAVCPSSVTHVRVWDLGGGVRYRIQIGPVDTQTVALVAENLDDIATLWYVDADGDGFGSDTEEPLVTFCEGPMGHAENQSGDCNDDDDAIHPNELGDVDELACNGVDDDCDGVEDDGFVLGAACDVGMGVCASTGVTICANDLERTTCDAVPLASSAESCNGLDDDCDGEADEGSICEDAGVGPSDAGLMPDDATLGMDATVVVDADGAPDASQGDAGRMNASSGGGCASSAKRGGASLRSTLAVLLLAAFVLRRGRLRA